MATQSSAGPITKVAMYPTILSKGLPMGDCWQRDACNDFAPIASADKARHKSLICILELQQRLGIELRYYLHPKG